MTDRPKALITGATRRVGLAIAQELAQAGCDLIITYRSKKDEALAAQNQLQATGAQTRLECVDFDDLETTQAWATNLAKDTPRLDILVHNAAVYAPTPLSDLTAHAAESFFRINAIAPLLLSQTFAPLLSASPLRGGGSIVALADIHAMGRPRRDFAPYAMSKAAIVEMVRSLARDLAPAIRVNGIAPGVVAWPKTGYESDPDSQAEYLAKVPLARAGTPQDAAAAVRWLALDAHYVTGEILKIDGGRSLA